MKHRIHVLSDEELQEMLKEKTFSYALYTALSYMQRSRPVWNCMRHRPPEFGTNVGSDGSIAIIISCDCQEWQNEVYLHLGHLNCENILLRKIKEENDRINQVRVNVPMGQMAAQWSMAPNEMRTIRPTVPVSWRVYPQPPTNEHGYFGTLNQQVVENSTEEIRARDNYLSRWFRR